MPQNQGRHFEIHRQVVKTSPLVMRWNEFRAYYKQLGRSPTAQEVLNFSSGLDYGD